ncbi:MAG: hypothetical protein WCS70_09490 [Verrucomicrobiota bacterium]
MAVSKIGARGVITNKGTPVNGDAIDSGDPALDALVIPTSACPTIDLTVEPLDVLDQQNNADPNSYQYVINAEGSDAGTAFKITWYDWLPDASPADRDDLMANGRKLAELTLVGPVSLSNYDCILVRSAKGRDYIHVVTAGTAASLPFNLTCPGNVTAWCGGPVQYPNTNVFVITGGVAPYTLTFDPPADSVPNGATNLVTVTATDANGCTTPACQFNVIRLPLTIACPGDVTAFCSSAVKYPATNTFVVTGGTPPYTLTMTPPANLLPNVPTNVVTVTATDANGCTTAPCSFKVIRLPFTIACPGDVTVGCDDLVQYPPTSSFQIRGGIAPYTLTFNPPVGQLPSTPTNVVSVTATDASGCTTAPCTFKVIRNANVAFTGFDSPISGVGGTCAAPLRTVQRGAQIVVKFTATCNGSSLAAAPLVEVFNCTTGVKLASGNAIKDTPSNWHFNVDTSLASYRDASIRIVVRLPNNNDKIAIIKLKG